MYLTTENSSQVWRLTSTTPALGKSRQDQRFTAVGNISIRNNLALQVFTLTRGKY